MVMSSSPLVPVGGQKDRHARVRLRSELGKAVGELSAG
jgi:hypothetical protein